METLSRYPAFSVASMSIRKPDSTSQGGGKPSLVVDEGGVLAELGFDDSLEVVEHVAPD